VATARMTVRRALGSQDDLQKRGEHCSAASDTLAELGIERRQQIRVIRGDDEYALYTVSEVHPRTQTPVIRMGQVGRDRLRGPEEFDADIDTRVANQDLDDEKAEENSEFVERLCDDGASDLIVIAPHGGDIEPHTDEQARHVVTCLAPQRVTLWLCRGWKDGGGAHERWHITSTDLNPASFPLLGSVASRGFTFAVAFHGFDDEPGVLIGGAAPDDLKSELRDEIDGVLPSEFGVRVAVPGDNNAGDSEDNLVNRLTRGGLNGVQIEQGPIARSRHGLAIAEAVADVYRRHLPTP
jgi:phage replication-related protein YjqB (UPF0714/DUF867 family)